MGRDTRKPVFGICKKQRLRPACACEQTDQRLCYSFFGKYTQTKKDTSHFHDTLSFDPFKMSQQKKKNTHTKMFTKRSTHENGNYLI